MRKTHKKLFGSRVVKTGVAVFLTSLICQWLNWPAVFAVITAIVTIEPTVNDSIKKGIIRFPASAIGSAYAVFFISLFGNSPLTYTAAAIFTIITCFKLKLHAGLLVATLTSVAMIEVIHDHYLIAFFIRLGTTSIGLLVSTAVNMFVLPPNYSSRILTNIDTALANTGEELKAIAKDILFQTQDCAQRVRVQETFAQLKKKLDTTDKLLHYQQSEAKYHRLSKELKQELQDEEEKLTALRLVHYHIGNLINTPLEDITWTKEQCTHIVTTVQALADTMENPDSFRIQQHRQYIKNLMEQFWQCKKEEQLIYKEDPSTFFNPEIVILYELLSIYHLVEQMLNTNDEQTKKASLH
ncbi:Fusaric acid resistance protein family protein [Paraliobacillus sp. PM-2]|uniref:aromatic acid exporter family protein n=1 Tax=Paraliobacillus sp. PM-2 TaxID=1462524 RepID=UPI00061C989C|nr:aromatic acid exporter family protein [Paraliobacillus sp. PM-2]CQR46383.1 Fusaric acid resistance protein family protein [Paraliobacillus sp. PM-2]